MKASASVENAGRRAAVQWIKGQTNRERRRIESRIGAIFASKEGEDAFFVNDIDAYTVGERLFLLLSETDRDDFDRADAAEFWGSLNDDAEPDVDFVYGFAHGIID